MKLSLKEILQRLSAIDDFGDTAKAVYSHVEKAGYLESSSKLTDAINEISYATSEEREAFWDLIITILIEEMSEECLIREVEKLRLLFQLSNETHMADYCCRFLDTLDGYIAK